MPITNDSLLKAVAAFKRDASKEFYDVVKALIDLVWAKREPTADFLFENDPELDDEANALLRGLSESLVKKAKERAESVLRQQLEYYNIEAAWDYVDDSNDSVTVLTRFDMQGSHLKELLEIWIALAVVNGIKKSELRVLISRYINNPFTSPLWRGIPLDALKWGKGYSKNILEQITIIGQNGIIGAVRYGEWLEEMNNGALYYVRRRGSNYDCDMCDEMANKPIPIEVPFEVPHSRCCCYPEYFYETIV